MGKTAIGIDFGGTTVKSGVVADGEIIGRLLPIRTHDHRDPDSLLAAIRGAIDELRAQHPDVASVGAGLPGLIDSVNGRGWEVLSFAGGVKFSLSANRV
jgi:glucokinase